MTETRTPAPMTWQQRLLWLVVLLAVQLLYFPINRGVQGGRALVTPWDALVPIWPVWVVPYLLSIAWWLGSYVWAACKMDDDLYRALVVAALAVTLSSYVVFILFPTYVERPVLEGQGGAVDLLRSLYDHDRVNNAFPSGHVYNTMLIVLFWWRWRPRLRWLWGLIAIIVVLSTLFTGQHHLLDPIGGAIWAWAGSRFGLWWVARRTAGG